MEPMTRRELLAAGLGSVLTGCAGGPPGDVPAPETARTHDWNLRYAPRMGLLGDEVPTEEHLEIYAEYGFRAFEYNGLPRAKTLAKAEALRKKMDELGMEMGVFVVNSGGWRGDALVDAKFHDGFLADVDKALEYHNVMRNRWSTVTTGLSVDYLSLERQTENVIEGLKKAAERIARHGL